MKIDRSNLPLLVGSGLALSLLGGAVWLVSCSSPGKPPLEPGFARLDTTIVCDTMIDTIPEPPPPPPPPSAGTAYVQTFENWTPAENALPQWANDPGIGPDGTTYRHQSLAWTLEPGGGIRYQWPDSELPGVLRVDFPATGGCSGPGGVCNGQLSVRFDEPIGGRVTLRWTDKLGDAGQDIGGEGEWWAGAAYKYLLIWFESGHRPGIAIWNRPGICPDAETWIVTALEPSPIICVPFGDWDAIWAEWEFRLDFDADDGQGRGELRRNGQLIAEGQIDGAIGIREIAWGANLNENPPAPQTRYFDGFSVERGE